MTNDHDDRKPTVCEQAFQTVLFIFLQLDMIDAWMDWKIYINFIGAEQKKVWSLHQLLCSVYRTLAPCMCQAFIDYERMLFVI